ncbi:MAG: peptide chain release factor N(5)-glutamine methyltransferase [Mogibacterium sp.]|nr:peptide chain release factor N(5)-glutamine methyltransferase [Mogibacterium sp.]
MAKMDYSKIFIKEACPTSIGGQAVMEGVMMQGTDRIALAMRLPTGELYLKTKKKPAPSKAMKIPLVRGVVAFAHSLISGMSTLMESADILEKYAPEMYAEEPGKLEAWINKKFGDKAAWNFLMTSALLFAIAISILFFVILPTWAVNFLGRWISNAIILNLIEGLLRIAIFIGYVVAIRKMDDIMTLFRYHGAEHKTIHCFENNLELTPENAAQFYTLHPRCGTSFLVFVLIISLLLFSFLGWPNLFWRIASRILLIPVIAGISYELLKWAGRSDGRIVRILSWPGLMLQKLTTAEPTNEQLEVGILSLKAVLVDPEAPEIEGFVDKDGFLLPDRMWADGSEALQKKLPDEQEEVNEESINEAIKFLDSLDANGYTIVTPPSEGTISLAKGIAEHNKEKAKERTIANRFTNDITTIENALKWGQATLSMIENGKNEATMIMSYATGLTRTQLITRGKELMREEDFKVYEQRIQARLTGTPLQYILGMQEFMGIPFRVNPSVLIPRLDTEVVVEEALKLLKAKDQEWMHPEVLDLCTGSGAIGISIAYKMPEALITMTDVSQDALHTAMGNAGLNKVNKRCIFLLGDMFEALPEDKKYDMIICNPPYIESDVIDTLDVEVKDHEPRLALDGGKDGLDFYRTIADKASGHLRSGGYLVLEIGAEQAGDVKRLLGKTKAYDDIHKAKDLAGLDRVIIAERI